MKQSLYIILFLCISLKSVAQTNKPYTDKFLLSKDMLDAVKKNDVKKIKEIVSRLVAPYQQFKKEVLPINDKGADDENINRNQATNFIQYNSMYVADSNIYNQYATDYYLSGFIPSLLNDDKSLAPFGTNTYLITSAEDSIYGSTHNNVIGVLFETKDFVNMIDIEGLLTIKDNLYIGRQCSYYSFLKNDLPLFIKVKYKPKFVAYKLNNNKFEKFNGDTLLFEDAVYEEDIIEEEAYQKLDASPIIEAPETETTKEQLSNKEDVTKESDIFDRAEEMPSFPNGVVGLMKYLKENLRYPKLAVKNKLEGKVIVKFVVDKNGNAIEPVVIKDAVGAGCADEAIRLINNMPKWWPAKQNGKAVKAYYILPINFRLND